MALLLFNASTISAFPFTGSVPQIRDFRLPSRGGDGQLSTEGGVRLATAVEVSALRSWSAYAVGTCVLTQFGSGVVTAFRPGADAPSIYTVPALGSFERALH